MRDMRAHGIDMLTIGQYLAPSGHHLPVRRYVHPDTFRMFEAAGCRDGLLARRGGRDGAQQLPRRPAGARRRRRLSRVSQTDTTEEGASPCKRRQVTLGLVAGAGWWAGHARAGLLSEGDAAAGIRTALERGADLRRQPAGPRRRLPRPTRRSRSRCRARWKTVPSCCACDGPAGQGRRADHRDEPRRRGRRAGGQGDARQCREDRLRAGRAEDREGRRDLGHRLLRRQARGLPLFDKFLPIVTRATEKVQLAERYNAVAGKGVGPGPGEEGRRQRPALRHQQGAGRHVPDHRRGREEDPRRSGGHRQRDPEEGLRASEPRRSADQRISA